jgi:MoxR-like ATPase
MNLQHTARPLGTDVLARMQQTLGGMPVAVPVKDYAIRLYRASNPQFDDSPVMTKRYVRYGASPRGAQALILAARVWALLSGRFHVASADVKRAAIPTLRHRLVLNFEAEAEGVNTLQIISKLVEEVPEGPPR